MRGEDPGGAADTCAGSNMSHPPETVNVDAISSSSLVSSAVTGSASHTLVDLKVLTARKKERDSIRPDPVFSRSLEPDRIKLRQVKELMASKEDELKRRHASKPTSSKGSVHKDSASVCSVGSTSAVSDHITARDAVRRTAADLRKVASQPIAPGVSIEQAQRDAVDVFLVATSDLPQEKAQVLLRALERVVSVFCVSAASSAAVSKGTTLADRKTRAPPVSSHTQRLLSDAQTSIPQGYRQRGQPAYSCSSAVSTSSYASAASTTSAANQKLNVGHMLHTASGCDQVRAPPQRPRHVLGKQPSQPDHVVTPASTPPIARPQGQGFPFSLLQHPNEPHSHNTHSVNPAGKPGLSLSRETSTRFFEQGDAFVPQDSAMHRCMPTQSADPVQSGLRTFLGSRNQSGGNPSDETEKRLPARWYPSQPPPLVSLSEADAEFAEVHSPITAEAGDNHPFPVLHTGDEDRLFTQDTHMYPDPATLSFDPSSKASLGEYPNIMSYPMFSSSHAQSHRDYHPMPLDIHLQFPSQNSSEYPTASTRQPPSRPGARSLFDAQHRVERPETMDPFFPMSSSIQVTPSLGGEGVPALEEDQKVPDPNNLADLLTRAQELGLPKPPPSKKHRTQLEMNMHRLQQRYKQIRSGKQTKGYRFCEEAQIARPSSPNIYQVCSKRAWDGQLRLWRKMLEQLFQQHNPEHPDEQDQSLERDDSQQDVSLDTVG
ncbi:hypothetical protein DIPPA_63293 [Diplonema papillatum]|nr:hypothetical protein DIPPA_63293 [Diplonema papillatum]